MGDIRNVSKSSKARSRRIIKLAPMTRAVRSALAVSALVTAAWSASGTAFAGQSDRHSGRWIIPTNKPDRFGLKVMAFNPILKPDLASYRLSISGLVQEPLQLTTADLDRLARVKQSSRLKCVQCWSGRVDWEGFRAQELLKLAAPKAEARSGRISTLMRSRARPASGCGRCRSSSSTPMARRPTVCCATGRRRRSTCTSTTATHSNGSGFAA